MDGPFSLEVFRSLAFQPPSTVRLSPLINDAFGLQGTPWPQQFRSLPQSGHEHGGSILGETFGYGSSDPARRSCDKGELVLVLDSYSCFSFRRFWPRRHGGEQRNKALDKGRVSQYRVSQRGKRQSRYHRNLHRRQDLTCADTKPGEAKDAIPISLNQGL